MTALATPRIVAPRPTLPRGLETPGRATRRSFVHALALGLVWLAVASASIVFTEPAPTDALTIAAIVLLPIIGLVAFRPAHIALAAVWLVVVASGFVAAIDAGEWADATKHTAISLYLAAASVVLAGFVSLKPGPHTRLLLNAHLAGCIVAALAGLAGYFEIVPEAKELFVKFERASGPFKDPNVFGPYLVPGLVYALHLWLVRPLHRGLLPALVFALLSLALLLSFSRGAWASAVLAIGAYLYLSFVTTRRNRDRIRIIGLCTAGLAMLVPLLMVALQHDAVGNLFSQRATLTQSYDVGPEGRFGGQQKAFDLIGAHPLGIGALEFPRRHHHEDVHNVYLSMYLNAGWIGGSMFLSLMAALLVLGLAHALRLSDVSGIFLVAYSAFAANALVGAVIDTDHWRHLYLLIAMVVGLMASRRRATARASRIVADRRPILLRPVVVIGPSRRGPRIVPRRAEVVDLFPDPLRHRPAGGFRRAARLLGPVQPKRPARLLGRSLAKA